MTDELDILTRRLLDGELDDAEVREALHRIADDPEARALLCAELQMPETLARGAAPPAAFADRVMERLPQEAGTAPEAESNTNHEATAAPLRRLLAWVTRPTTVRVRPAWGGALAVAVALLVGLAWWPSAGPTSPAAPTAAQEAPAASEQAGAAAATTQRATTRSADQTARESTVWARFVYVDDDASSVAVAGDFSQWDPIPLEARTADGKTVWTGLVPVSRGEHEYMFVVDGSKWVTDPLAPVQRSDGFGAKNAVLKL
jgi:hypothetical protein